MTDDDRSRALAELLSTPLDAVATDDETPDRNPRRTPGGMGTVVALVVGAAIVVTGYVAAAGGDEETAATPTTPPVTTGPPVTAVDRTFPDGYSPIDDAVAVRVIRVARSGPDLAVTMVSAAARNIDAEASSPFTGGRWTAVLRDGTTVPARGQLVDQATPGVVSVLFDPDEVTADTLAELRLAERWITTRVDVIQDLAVSTQLPWSLPERAVVDLGDGSQLVVDAMELSETGGFVEWSLAGGTALGVVTVEIALEEGSFDGQPRMIIPIARIDRFFFDPETAASQGRIELSGPTAADGEGLARGFAFWSVQLTVTAPADAVVAVDGAPGDA